MSEILDRLKNLENERPTVLRSAATLTPRVRRSTVRRTRLRVTLFFAIALSVSFLYFQFKIHFSPAEQVPSAAVDVSEIQNQKNQIAIESYQKGDFKAALESFEKLVADQPERAEFHVNLAMASAKLGNLDKALEQLKLATTLDPKNSVAFNNLGLIAEQQKQLPLAQQSFEKAVQLNPTSPELRLNLAAFYEKTGQLKLSVSAYEDYSRLPASDQKTVELLKKRIPRLNSLTVQTERDEESQ